MPVNYTSNIKLDISSRDLTRVRVREIDLPVFTTSIPYNITRRT